MKSVAIIGGGPAGLAAAEVIATAGMAVTVYDAKPSLARKFLMAGKSGLNLTFDAPVQNLIESYAEAGAWLSSSIAAFDSTNIIDWAEGLGQEIFRGSTGRVFPKVMKASPLLRAWLVRLDDLGVTQHTRWRWCGWNKGALSFDTPDGHRAVTVDAVVLALGGASWARLGSDGAWAEILTAKGIKPTAFDAANAAVAVTWSNFMTKHLGKPIKGVAWCA
nr:TIGR03862 family flavoprotein [Alphaproteobacteria bacterium]